MLDIWLIPARWRPRQQCQRQVHHISNAGVQFFDDKAIQEHHRFSYCFLRTSIRRALTAKEIAIKMGYLMTTPIILPFEIKNVNVDALTRIYDRQLHVGKLIMLLTLIATPIPRSQAIMRVVDRVYRIGQQSNVVVATAGKR